MLFFTKSYIAHRLSHDFYVVYIVYTELIRTIRRSLFVYVCEGVINTIPDFE